MTGIPNNKLSSVAVEDITNELVHDTFWKKTNRKKKWLKSHELGPNQFHSWGTLNYITEKSLALAKLIKVGNTDGLNHKSTFEAVLNELSLHFKICYLKIDSKHKGSSIACYDIDSVPKWSFSACASTQTEAVHNAAKKGLEFFMTLGQ